MLIPYSNIFAQEIDTDYWYKISNVFLGDEYSLSVKDNDDHNPVMSPAANLQEQRWKFIKEHDNYYRIINEHVGEYRSLDNYLDGSNEPFLGKTGIFFAQFWLLTHIEKDSYKLTNSFLGKRTVLSINPKDKLLPIMEKLNNKKVQVWRIQKIEPIHHQSEVPLINNSK